MADDVLINKIAVIERCIARAQEEYQHNPATFDHDFTRQDAAILNIQRACEAALDMGQYIIRQHKLGVPQSARDVFALLAQNNWIREELSEKLQHMVGFRNIAVHNYQKLQIAVIVAIINQHLDDFLQYTRTILLNSSKNK